MGQLSDVDGDNGDVSMFKPVDIRIPFFLCDECKRLALTGESDPGNFSLVVGVENVMVGKRNVKKGSLGEGMGGGCILDDGGDIWRKSSKLRVCHTGR